MSPPDRGVSKYKLVPMSFRVVLHSGLGLPWCIGKCLYGEMNYIFTFNWKWKDLGSVVLAAESRFCVFITPRDLPMAN